MLPVFATCCAGLTSDGYLRADGHGPGSRDYEEHLYVNTQSLEGLEAMAERGRSACCPESPKKDIFDMSESRLLWSGSRADCPDDLYMNEMTDT